MFIGNTEVFAIESEGLWRPQPGLGYLLGNFRYWVAGKQYSRTDRDDLWLSGNMFKLRDLCEVYEPVEMPDLFDEDIMPVLSALAVSEWTSLLYDPDDEYTERPAEAVDCYQPILRKYNREQLLKQVLIPAPEMTDGDSILGFIVCSGKVRVIAAKLADVEDANGEDELWSLNEISEVTIRWDEFYYLMNAAFEWLERCPVEIPDWFERRWTSG